MKSWYYLVNGEQCGPVPRDTIRDMLSRGEITRDTLLWCEGMEDWKALAQVPDFQSGETASESAPPGAEPVGPVESAVPGRPTSVTVFGILNIVFGGMGVACSPFGGAMVAISSAEMQFAPAYRAYIIVSMILGFLFAVLELASGIGLLMTKRWARIAALVYGYAAIILGIVGTIVSVVMVATGAFGDQPGTTPGAIGGTVGGLIGLIYPVLLVIFMSKDEAIESCVK